MQRKRRDRRTARALPSALEIFLAPFSACLGFFPYLSCAFASLRICFSQSVPARNLSPQRFSALLCVLCVKNLPAPFFCLLEPACALSFLLVTLLFCNA